MSTLLIILQIVLSLAVTLMILVQTRGTGFSRGTGGSASFTRRGLEKVVFKSTFVVSALFLIISVLTLAL